MTNGVYAQSLMDNLPPVVIEAPAEAPALLPPSAVTPTQTPSAQAPAAQAASGDIYTVADVSADVTADTAAHARDQALMQAERSAFAQLCMRLNAPESATKMDDDAVAATVHSFEVQSEHVSAVRYIGVFTIRFKPSALQKKLGKYIAAASDAGGNPTPYQDTKSLSQSPLSHLSVAVQTESLADWTQIKRRLTALPSVVKVEVIDLGRGVSHIDISYAGAISDLQQTLTAQGLILRQNASANWELYDGSMVPR